MWNTSGPFTLSSAFFVGFQSQNLNFFKEMHLLFSRQVTTLLGWLEVSHPSEFAITKFVPRLTQLERVKSLEFIFLSPSKQDNILGIMKRNLFLIL